VPNGFIIENKAPNDKINKSICFLFKSR
jgi:hypothetical protein